MLLSKSGYLEVPQKQMMSKSQCSNSENDSDTGRKLLYRSCGNSAHGSAETDDLQQQILKYKQKAHQSFMQVMQMQQLHEDELEMLRSEFQDKLAQRNSQIAQLQLKNKQLEYDNKMLQKNAKQHNIDLTESEFTIENIDAIATEEESQLDQSVMAHFRELVDIRTEQENITELRRSLMGEVRKIGGSKIIESLLQRLFDYVTFLKQQFLCIHQKMLELQRQHENTVSRDKSSKFSIESLQKENKFMTEHLKRITKQKLQSDKKVHQLSASLKDLQTKVTRGEGGGCAKRQDALTRMRKQQERESSLDINEFISTNFNKIATQHSMPEKTKTNLVKRSRH